MTDALDMVHLAWGLLEGGELTGKYNVPSSEPRRSKDTSERIKSIAAVLMGIAKETGHTPSQVAINWARQKFSNIIPIIGARTERQLNDNLGCLDFALANEEIDRLNEAGSMDLGFPHSFLGSDHVRGLIFGKTFEQILK
jgi:aryl-alcohol dehydrogenase-like predicted oxidoreductase